MKIIDSHAHVVGDHPETVALLAELGVRVVNVCIAREPDEPWREEAARYQELTAEYPEQYAWCTAFDMPGYGDPDYADRAIASLAADFAAGATSVKVWKNIGMSLRRPDGSYAMVDDEVFEPIFAFLEREDRPVVMHLADPQAAWRPLVPGAPHYKYYSQHPKWHFHGRTDVPQHEAILAARARLLDRHPRLRVIGAHLGSMEHDLGVVADALRRWPCFAVDASARLANLMVHAAADREKVLALFREFPDRLLYGTDHVSRTPHSQLAPEKRADFYRWVREAHQAWWAFLTTDEEVTYLDFKARGLALSDDVLELFYHGNARRWLDNL